MGNIRQGSIRLFRLAGIDLFLHWSWFLVAAFEINARTRSYSSLAWNVAEYLALFLIVMLHEFGHALACRQVGGSANQIVLWPLGGVAYVDPPPRPGATLWSIAAGPLVNVVLLPVLYLLLPASDSPMALSDAGKLLHAVYVINWYLLLFNLLPIYPLDGGQILRSLLWFVLGRARSLMVATVIGLAGVVGLVLLAFLRESVWLGVLSAFILMNCWSGLRQARVLLRLAKLPRRPGLACPWCKTAPILGTSCQCGRCGQGFDTFQTQGVCPYCASRFAEAQCLDCGRSFPFEQWSVPSLYVPQP
jgi:Zn-dependent protease